MPRVGVSLFAPVNEVLTSQYEAHQQHAAQQVRGSPCPDCLATGTVICAAYERVWRKLGKFYHPKTKLAGAEQDF